MKHVIILIPEGYANLSSVTGAFQVLVKANAYWKQKGNPSRISVRLAGFGGDLHLDEGLFSIHPEDLRQIGPPDLVIIPAVSHQYDRLIAENAALITWIREAYKSGAEVASMCTGAFLLAATGLLDGKSCSTHWNAASAFGRMFPRVELRSDKVVTAEQGIYTNGGAYSFLNLVLVLVERYFDRETAIYCSKIFQIDIERASQSPFSIFQSQKEHGDPVVERAQQYLEEHLDKKISFEQLASTLAVSRRNFDRRFIKATGNTPMEYLQRVKVEVAKSTLEKGRKSIFEVMSDVGYADDKAFREVFKRITGISPLDYRARYSRRVGGAG